MYRKYLVSVLTVVALLAPLGGLTEVQAQEGGLEGIEIRPSLFESRLQPGQSVTHIVNVKNRSDAAIVLYSTVRDIDSMDERGAPIWSDPNLEKTGAELSSWTTFSHNSIFLEPEETVEVSVFISVPANAPNGGAFGMAAFVKDPPALTELGGESGLGVGFTTGSLIAVAIGDEIVDDALLRKFDANPGIGGGPGVTFDSTIENVGNALIRPVGTIEVSNMFGKFTSSVSFNENGGAILPGSLRGYETGWEGDGFVMGRYTADIFISYGLDVRKTLVGTTSFWILPAKPLMFGLGGALVAFLIVLMWVRSYIRSRLRDAGQSDGPSGSRPSSFVAVLVSALIIAALGLAFAFLFLA